jgi:DNA-directed RNA polymerase alpha subunit
VYSKKPTSVDNVALVQVVYGIEYLANGLRRILLSELAILANAVEQLAANS